MIDRSGNSDLAAKEASSSDSPDRSWLFQIDFIVLSEILESAGDFWEVRGRRGSSHLTPP